ncbi:hypothetical protein FTUN_8476 [Frigoriglobus tundricola]|uniref:Uncharacterized protein n=1 Tax=Frigoriglobus tundricola TaxID=2774151 RepID=A0A6M5Z342_9BACT|nr:hypothetical protein FTUN_8476 [Frigoriglobus tundricola]
MPRRAPEWLLAVLWPVAALVTVLLWLVSPGPPVSVRRCRYCEQVKRCYDGPVCADCADDPENPLAIYTRP